MAGIGNQTAKRVVIDDATIYINYGEADERIIGCTTKADFVVEREYRDIFEEIAPGPIEGGVRIIGEKVMISGSLMELTTDNLKLLLPGNAVADFPAVTPTHDEITSTMKIADTDYIKNVAAVGLQNGTGEDVVCMIENALNLENFQLQTAPKGEATVPFKFVGHYKPDGLSTPPYKIRYPKVA